MNTFYERYYKCIKKLVQEDLGENTIAFHFSYIPDIEPSSPLSCIQLPNKTFDWFETYVHNHHWSFLHQA